MINKTYNLIFDGPFGFVAEHERCLLNDEKAKLCGIYINAVPYFKGGYLPTYVGQTGRTFGKRVTEHIIHLIGGYNRISDPNFLVYATENILWHGLWGKGVKDKIEEYPSKLPELISAIQGYLTTEVLFIAEIQTDNRTRERIESSIAYHISDHSDLAASLFRSDIRYRPRKSHEMKIEIIISSKENIHGLPEHLFA